MALGDLASLQMFFLSPDAQAQCAMSFQCVSPSPAWRSDLATEFRTEIVPYWMACLGFNVALREIVVKDVVPGTGADVLLTLTPQPHGTGGTLEAPANAAYVVSWRSDGIGRNTRGRTYMFGLPRLSTVNSTQWSPGLFDSVEAMVDRVFGRFGPIGLSTNARLVVISRGPHGAPLATPESFPITHAVYDREIRSMRKRLPS